MKDKKQQLLKEIEFEARETRRIFGREPSPVWKVVKNIIMAIIMYALFLIPYTLLAASYTPVAYTLYVGLSIGILLFALIKKKYKNLDMTDLNPLGFANVTTASITYVLLFISILTLIPAVISYYSQAYYLSIYEYLSSAIYLTLTCLFMPALETFFLRKLIVKASKQKLKIFLVVFNTALVYIIQPYFVYGIFFMIPSLILNIYVMKTNRNFSSYIMQMIFNFIFAISLLYLSEAKLLLLIIFAVILLITLVLNIYRLALDKAKK